MKKSIKVLFLVLIIIVLLFTVFITFESLRLKNNPGELPLIILDQNKISLDDYSDQETVKKKYFSLGFTVEYEYLINKKENSDVINVITIGEDFQLFNLIRLWAWIS